MIKKKEKMNKLHISPLAHFLPWYRGECTHGEGPPMEPVAWHQAPGTKPLTGTAGGLHTSVRPLFCLSPTLLGLLYLSLLMTLPPLPLSTTPPLAPVSQPSTPF